MPSVIPYLSERSFVPHALHAPDRAWPQSNCHTDLLIELMATLGRDPVAALGMTVAQDFEGDQFTFFKMPLGDLDALFGLDIQELSIYRSLSGQVEEQVARGRVVLVEVDAFYLPDTQEITYKAEHSKTTIGVNHYDRAARTLGYFHNAGYYDISGDDVDALFAAAPPGQLPLPPYVEFVRIAPRGLAGAALTQAVAERFSHHLSRRPAANPVEAYRAAIPAHLERLIADAGCFHDYAFNVSRQYGANIAALAAHLDWLTSHGVGDFSQAARRAEKIAASAKTFQFLLARAAAKRRADGLDDALARLAEAHDDVFAAILAAFPARSASLQLV